MEILVFVKVAMAQTHRIAAERVPMWQKDGAHSISTGGGGSLAITRKPLSWIIVGQMFTRVMIYARHIPLL